MKHFPPSVKIADIENIVSVCQKQRFKLAKAEDSSE